MSSTLHFDTLSCQGGRDRYVARMLAHYRNLHRLSSRPSQLRHMRPKAPFDGGKRRTPRPAAKPSAEWRAAHAPEFSEVRHAAAAAARAKPFVNARRSAADVALSARLSNNRRANAQNVQLEQHRKNLTNMVRRIESVDSLDARKKSGIDWRLNPPVKLQRRSTAPADAALLVQQALVNQRERAKQPRPSSARGSSRRASSSAAPPVSAPSRPRTAPSGGARATSAPALRAATQQPSRKAASAAPVSLTLSASDGFSQLRDKILSAIVQRRLYREADLRSFLGRVARDNQHLDASQLSALISEIKTAFFL